MRVVVVGATGNVGTALLDRLHAAPEITDVVGIARRAPEPVGPYAGVSWHEIDIADAGSVSKLTVAFAGADAVVNAAWLLQPNHRERVLAATNVHGLARVLQAVVAAGVPQVVDTSSVGAYSPGPKRRRVDESWPTGGIHTSHYGRQKSFNERVLDTFELRFPQVVVTRIRPGLVGHTRAGADQHRLFLGPWIPLGWFNRVKPPVLPLPSRAIAQVVDAHDLGDAFVRAIVRRAPGAFNIATEPVVTPDLVARSLGSRALPVRPGPVRALLAVLWRLHLVRSDPGWLDIAITVPLMDTSRARTLLGWEPKVAAEAVVREGIGAVAARTSEPSSPHLRRGPQPKRD